MLLTGRKLLRQLKQRQQKIWLTLRKQLTNRRRHLKLKQLRIKRNMMQLSQPKQQPTPLLKYKQKKLKKPQLQLDKQ
jgi:hypothetical protein